MPMQKATAKVNLSSSLKAHAADPTEQKQDFSRLPGGITGGVARLIAAKRGVYATGDNKGQQFIRMAATVLEPHSVIVTLKTLVDGINGKTGKPGKVLQISSPHEVKIVGLQTSIMLPLCDIKKGNGDVITADENVANALNELRLVGGDECTNGIEDEAGLDSLLSELVKVKPCIRFSTQTPDPTEQYPEPRTFERWYGAVESYEANGQASSAVLDNTGVTEATAGEPTEATDQPSNESPTEEELAELVAQAADTESPEGQAARDQLESLALASGASAEDVQNAADWEAVAAMITGTTEAATEGDGSEASTEPWKPAKEECYKYQPVDPKSKKPMIDPKTKKPKLIEVEVDSVDENNETVNVHSLDNPKLKYPKVKWDDLKSVQSGL